MDYRKREKRIMSTESAAPAPAPQPAQKKGGIGKKILGYIVALIVGGIAIYGFNYFTSDAAQAKAGDCASVTGTETSPVYKAVACSSAEANHVVGKAGSLSEVCGGDYLEYTQTQRRGPSSKVCLAPLLEEGKCYSASGADVAAKVAECAGSNVIKVTKAVKTAAPLECAQGEKAYAYPEAKLNYCFGAPA